MKSTWAPCRDPCLWTILQFMGREECSQSLESQMQVGITAGEKQFKDELNFNNLDLLHFISRKIGTETRDNLV